MSALEMAGNAANFEDLHDSFIPQIDNLVVSYNIFESEPPIGARNGHSIKKGHSILDRQSLVCIG
jgi:hypothetical protein